MTTATKTSRFGKAVAIRCWNGTLGVKTECGIITEDGKKHRYDYFDQLARPEFLDGRPYEIVGFSRRHYAMLARCEWLTDQEIRRGVEDDLRFKGCGDSLDENR